jgi:hypothetical protein
VTFEFAVPPGTVHLRVAVDGKSRDDLDVFVYGQSTEYGDGSFTEGPHEVVDMPDPPADTYTVEVWPTIVDGHDAPFRLRWWVVPDESTWNVTAAPPKATRGASGIVRLTPPSPAGEWVGTIEHRTGPGQALRPTIVAVSPER